MAKASISEIRKKFHKLHDLFYTAHHESSHVIYGLLHGLKIDSVAVFEEKKSKRIEGWTAYKPFELSDIEDYTLFNDRIKSMICLFYAGFVGEKRFFKTVSGMDTLPLFLKEGSSNDFAEASLLIEKYNLAEPGRKRYNYKQKLMKQIDQELKEHWDAVSLIANQLIKKKKLNSLDLQALLIKKSNNKEFWKNKFKNPLT